jgi:hypothetical protein
MAKIDITNIDGDLKSLSSIYIDMLEINLVSEGAIPTTLFTNCSTTEMKYLDLVCCKTLHTPDHFMYIFQDKSRLRLID